MIHDITPPVSASIAVWPGDTPPTRDVLLDLKRGDNLTLSTLRSTMHVGAHADAPSHYGLDAASIEAQRLEPYIGDCHVIRIDAVRGTRIGPDALTGGLEAERVLFATGTYPDPSRFNEDFAALSPELIGSLAAQGATLVGIDTPSVDLFDSKDLPAHAACLEKSVFILEGLVLDGVLEGVYELIALPLKLAGFDASPVRAILRKFGE